MRMYDLIVKKKKGEKLTNSEITEMVAGYVNGEIPDYQMSAMLMAICFQGMDAEETASLTMEVARSGDMVDLSPIEGVKVDKHSTGGVGDKTTIVIGPIVAACGVKVAKMSGRGLGHTGGTIDKFEAIPGMKMALNQEEFFSIVNKVGVSVAGQSGNLAPADKKLYALRDVTGTVDSIPLIAASIMSKKLASGSDCIVLDVKTGSGAFMKTLESSIELSKAMVEIGEHAGRKTMAVVTDMDIPLGYAIGNSLEVIESVETLKGRGPKDLTEVCITLASNMLYVAGKGDIKECEAMAREALESGRAFDKLVEMVEAQGGDSSVIKDTNKFGATPYRSEVKAVRSGFVNHLNTEKCGIASVLLGAGRETLDSEIDYLAGLILNKKTGDYVEEGEVLAEMYASDKALFGKAEKLLQEAYLIKDEKPEMQPLIHAKVTADGVELAPVLAQ
ncbi:pyrimidine-nucleoside phosphorylase [Faecalicatena contorta]|uniref:Pyrimidine-nucleoside phosphorylase n=1 Tax=Faecalicatena contorta TaxID=39482 RepID=A0A316ALX7_9FIRM|nr:pyrimidine-nucleoside phosphorylase [Faecalicatena contorta]PWJ51027.1 pyrimidine-nucleoside phosphorylase [Faecalicatena contorta]SUQ13595.1 pyrimidine-nucleoside phosphorylase [Faecalicatena contorta]